MPDPIGPALTLAEKVFSWWTDEAGRLAIQKRARLRHKREECQRALDDKRFVDLRRLTDELERLSNEA